MIDDRQIVRFNETGLGRSEFRQIAANGWGDPFNAYAYSMAWFRGALYVGNSRGNLVMIHRHHPKWMKTWPVRTPREFHDLDFRAQIWRYTPFRNSWERVHYSPWVMSLKGRQVPRDIGYRSMAVHHGALYVAAFSTASSGLSPQILRSNYGSRFDAVSTVGTDPALNTFRILQAFCGRLYTSPTGRSGGEANSSNAAVVLESEDPSTQPWQDVSRLGFGDPNNLTFFEMAVFNEYLYVGTLNPFTGFQIWKSSVGRKPYRWSRVLTEGAYRGNLNEIAISMCPCKGALYVGTAIQNGGYDRAHKVGPAAPELIRIHPDDSWDLIVGSPRSTPDGEKFPLSGKGPGFDNPFNGYFWRMTVHDDCLYLGTYKWTVFLPYLKDDQWPSNFRWIVDRLNIDDLSYFAGGSIYGEVPMERIGTQLRETGLTTRTTMACEHCNQHHMACLLALLILSAQKSRSAVAKSGSIDLTQRGAWKSGSGQKRHPGRSSLNKGRRDKEKAMTLMSRRPVVPYPLLKPRDDFPQLQDKGTLKERINRRYDSQMYSDLVDEYYDGSGFHNFGYWTPDTGSQRQASENLVDLLVSFLPHSSGNILDVACGMGASTKHLVRQFLPSRIIGINISEKQLASCRRKAPDCRFLKMDATELRFSDNSIDNVLCVEAVFHFDTREKFLHEVYRVLKPGGGLALSDILVRSEQAASLLKYSPVANFVPSIQEYRSLFERQGFNQVKISDALEPCWKGFRDHWSAYIWSKVMTGQVPSAFFFRSCRRQQITDWLFRSYLLVSARKPRRRPPVVTIDE